MLSFEFVVTFSVILADKVKDLMRTKHKERLNSGRLPLLTGVVTLILMVFGPLSESVAQKIDPSDLWFSAYVRMKEGEELEREQKALAAYNKFVESKSLFDAVAREYPDYNPSIVRYRRKELADKLLTLKNFLRNGGPSRGAMPKTGMVTGESSTTGSRAGPVQIPSNPANPANPVQKPPSTGSNQLPTWNREFPNTPPSGGNVPPRPNAIVRPQQVPDPSTARPRTGSSSFTDASRQIQEQFQQMEERMRQVEIQNKSLNQDVASRESKLQEMQQRMTEAQRREQDLKRRFELLRREKGADKNAEKQIALLKNQLSGALDALEKVNQQNREILDELSITRAQLAELHKQRDELEKERNQLAAIIESSGGSSKAVARLTKINKKLREELTKARGYAESLAKFNGDQSVEVEILKEKIAEITEESQELVKENTRHESHIAELEKRLKDMSRGVVEMDAGSSAEALEENRLLRGVVLRQLRRQAQIKLARQMILAQLKELGVESKSLLASLDVISVGPGLTPAEKNLFKQPQVAEMIEGLGGELHGTILVEGNKDGVPVVSLQDLDEELVQLQKVARLDFQEGRYEGAARAYRKFLSYKPRNAEGICNLATVQMQLKKYDEAEKLLKQSINLKKRNGRAYYLLGVVCFERGKMDDALKHFDEGLQIDPKNAKALNCVGVISSQKGWVKRAEESFVKAVSIDPDYADAHFNLSILYTTGKKPNRKKAGEHYNKALKLGLPRDAKIEEVLNS
ncbi:MAG: tetratricopeptide repeat protein [Verrucomicrobia bacterium]|nr:tetratricopeptide repeat protein [Verrucomicrobiota bacterium]